MFDNSINLVGNLTADPEFKVTTGGVAVARFRLACSRRIFDRTANEWRDGDPAFFSVTAWRQLAQNIHTSLRKGDRAIVVGRIRQSSYATSNNERRTSWEVEADSVGAELSWSYAQVQRSRRASAETTTSAEAADGLPGGNGEAAGDLGEELDGDVSYLASEMAAQEHADIELGEPASV